MHKDLLSPGWFACDCRSERGEEPQDKASTADPDLVFNSLLREARSEVSKNFRNPLIQLGSNGELTRFRNLQLPRCAQSAPDYRHFCCGPREASNAFGQIRTLELRISARIRQSDETPTPPLRCETAQRYAGIAQTCEVSKTGSIPVRAAKLSRLDLRA